MSDIAPSADFDREPQDLALVSQVCVSRLANVTERLSRRALYLSFWSKFFAKNLFNDVKGLVFDCTGYWAATFREGVI